MQIQFNTDKNVSGNEKKEALVKQIILKELSRFDEKITRLEVHLSDENADKPGENDKKCLIEARVQYLKPIAATAYASTNERAVKEAALKLKAALTTTLERLAEKR